MAEPPRRVDAVWKLESSRIVAALTGLVHDVGLAEELAQDALVAALEQWPSTGVPENAGAWLTAIAKRRAIDHLRRADRRGRSHEELAREQGQKPDEPSGGDDVLRLMFLSCHPVLPTTHRVALTLRLLGGLTAAEIGRAFLVDEATIAARVAEAKQTLAAADVPFELPAEAVLAERLASVLEVVYLGFNEGYAATAGDDLLRTDLCLEALRLARMLAELAPGESEVHGLVALLEIQQSRAAARTGPKGEPIPLHEQERGRWDPLLIRRGFTAMLRARDLGGPPGPYLLQAAIAACHAQARRAEDTDWARIATLYGSLAALLPTPVVTLNRAVAVGMAEGPQAGLDLADTLVDHPRMRENHLLAGVRADLLARLERTAEARREFERAASLTANRSERSHLRNRADALTTTVTDGRSLSDACTAFLARDDLDAATVRSYAQTLRRLVRTLGERTPLATITPDEVTRAVVAAWGTAAPATWNRHCSAARSFAGWADADHLTAALERRPGSPARAASLPPERVDALCDDPARPLRERALWRLLHESGAPVTTVLALDVEHLDLEDRRARAGGRLVGWRSSSARLLPDLVAGRSRGPVFLSDRRPGPARRPAYADLCPETGRRRLSYERAEYLFKQATRGADPAGEGWTLRMLR